MVLVHLQPNTTKFKVRALTTSREQSRYRALFVSLPFYCGITVSIAPHLHNNLVKYDSIPTVLP